jgi:hypothetical protein
LSIFYRKKKGTTGSNQSEDNSASSNSCTNSPNVDLKDKSEENPEENIKENTPPQLPPLYVFPPKTLTAPAICPHVSITGTELANKDSWQMHAGGLTSSAAHNINDFIWARASLNPQLSDVTHDGKALVHQFVAAAKADFEAISPSHLRGVTSEYCVFLVRRSGFANLGTGWHRDGRQLRCTCQKKDVVPGLGSSAVAIPPHFVYGITLVGPTTRYIDQSLPACGIDCTCTNADMAIEGEDVRNTKYRSPACDCRCRGRVNGKKCRETSPMVGQMARWCTLERADAPFHTSPRVVGPRVFVVIFFSSKEEYLSRSARETRRK